MSNVTQFKNELRNFIQEWGLKNNHNMEHSKSRGMAFEDFVFETLVNRFEIDGASLEENVFRSDERNFDIILPPSGNSDCFIVCQCEMGGWGRKTNKKFDLEKMGNWFKRLSDLMSDDWINNQNFKPELENYLFDLKNHINNYKPVKWIYATNNSKHEKADSELSTIRHSQNYELYPAVETLIYALDELTNIYMETKKIETSVPEKIIFQHGEGKGIYDETGSAFFVGLISATVVSEWYQTHKESLFNQNIRTLLTKNRINTQMADTIKNQPRHFRHFNNGISAICEKLYYDKDQRRITAKKFSVINGAQTVGTLFDGRHGETLQDVEVLLRITQVKYSDVLSGDITKFNNTQNAVIAPDFRSNDPIQTWLENEFLKYSYPKYFQRIVYRRKRPFAKGRANETVVNIAVFAKIRRTYLYSSAEQNSNPNDVWKSKQDGGCYEVVFPDSGILDNREFVYFNFIFGIYKKLVDELENEKKCGGEKRKSLTRMALLGVEAFHEFWKKYSIDFPNHQDIADGKSESDKVFRKFWRSFYPELSKVYDREIVDGTSTAYSFVRSKPLTAEVIKNTLILYESARDFHM